MEQLQQLIDNAWEDRSQLKEKPVQEAIYHVMEQLDQGKLRVAEPTEDGDWKVNAWVKKAVVLYFPLAQMETIEVGPFEFH
ncbi:MAG: 2,3,4,5-tetrahydropyridine-2,6-dicarboxylate N-succinyltransferase, partial [Bacteroidetes bacterium]|nr:2,3,4,5-tetrahydropyridine-2,6-dicarboxylate N-succinyltransferase [Bacteroidota bacterium]